MKTVYVAGNPLVSVDSVPLNIMARLAGEFPHIAFKELEPTDDMPAERHLDIIDTVMGINDVAIIKDIDSIVANKVYSLHDFDLGMTLKLMKKAGRLDTVNIIGVPTHMAEKEAFEKVSEVLKKL